VTNLPTNIGKRKLEETITEQMLKIYPIEKFTG
jgi:hypothetical protein